MWWFKDSLTPGHTASWVKRAAPDDLGEEYEEDDVSEMARETFQKYDLGAARPPREACLAGGRVRGLVCASADRVFCGGRVGLTLRCMPARLQSVSTC